MTDATTYIERVTAHVKKIIVAERKAESFAWERAKLAGVLKRNPKARTPAREAELAKLEDRYLAARVRLYRLNRVVIPESTTDARRCSTRTVATMTK